MCGWVSLLIASLTTLIHACETSLLFGRQLRLDTQIETPAQNNNALELPKNRRAIPSSFSSSGQGRHAGRFKDIRSNWRCAARRSAATSTMFQAPI